MSGAAPIRLRDRIRELRELGIRGSAFRIKWEVQRRSGYFEVLDKPPIISPRTRRALEASIAQWPALLPFSDPDSVRSAIAPLLTRQNSTELVAEARRAASGHIRYFSDRLHDCGNPIQWHRAPVLGNQTSPDLHWARAVASVEGDIKDLWEMARFPHVFAIGRAATFSPEHRSELADALRLQIDGFIDSNPFARGIHWASGQEIAFRIFAWTFGLRSLLFDTKEHEFLFRVARHFLESGTHIARHIEYARRATHNNHLLSEAAGLLLVAHLLPVTDEAKGFARLGRSLLDEGIRHQFYADGGYIQHSHNYHRVALHDLLFGAELVARMGGLLPNEWKAAAIRSVEFLSSQQNIDGHLPNYGNNDGALVFPLSTCEYEDFRPILQALSIRFTGNRLYAKGPWDEEAAWFAPLPASAGAEPQSTAASPRSKSFMPSGYHVLHGSSRGSFCTFRCGTLLDRFTQIDMLQVDVFWRGHNVVTDAGSFRYNGAPRWHRHFLGTESHNTIMVDGQSQMLHMRQFKTIYPAEAVVLAFCDAQDYALVAGEHRGFERSASATHRRAILYLRDDLWLVFDTVSGTGIHGVRLQWLLERFPFVAHDSGCSVQTPAGEFSLQICDGEGLPVEVETVIGRHDPPRGWLSRKYGRKVAVPSLTVHRRLSLPCTLVTVMGARCTVRKEGTQLSIVHAGGGVRFQLQNGLPTDIEMIPPRERTDA